MRARVWASSVLPQPVADQEDVRLRQLDVVVLRRMGEALVVVVDRDREDLFRVGLADDIVVQDRDDLLRGRYALAGLHHRGFVLLADDVHAELDTLVANEDRRPGDQLTDFVLALSAERAIERVLGIAAARFAHSSFLPLGLNRTRLRLCEPASQRGQVPCRQGYRFLPEPRTEIHIIGHIANCLCGP
jgi:hypothetical protein